MEIALSFMTFTSETCSRSSLTGVHGLGDRPCPWAARVAPHSPFRQPDATITRDAHASENIPETKPLEPAGMSASDRMAMARMDPASRSTARATRLPRGHPQPACRALRNASGEQGMRAAMRTPWREPAPGLLVGDRLPHRILLRGILMHDRQITFLQLLETGAPIPRVGRKRSEQDVDFAPGEVGAHQPIQGSTGMIVGAVWMRTHGDRGPGNNGSLQDRVGLARSRCAGNAGQSHCNGDCAQFHVIPLGNLRLDLLDGRHGLMAAASTGGKSCPLSTVSASGHDNYRHLRERKRCRQLGRRKPASAVAGMEEEAGGAAGLGPQWSRPQLLRALKRRRIDQRRFHGPIRHIETQAADRARAGRYIQRHRIDALPRQRGFAAANG